MVSQPKKVTLTRIENNANRKNKSKTIGKDQR